MKGQYFTIDVIIAGVVALLVLILLINYWQYSLENNTLYRDSLNKEAIRVSLLLFSKNSDFSLINSSSISALKTDNVSEMAKIIGKLNDSVYVKVSVFMDGQKVFGGKDIGFPQAKVSRMVWDPYEEKLRRIDIYVSRV